MTTLNLILFGLYLLLTVVLGMWVGRRIASDAKDYFLAGEGLPWYAIGGSIIAANISTEHFIGMVGVAYGVGFVVAQWEWGNVITFSFLIWMFLPFYVRGGLYTMPEFLERRYNAHCRRLFAVCCLVLWIVAQMAVVMLAGAKAMRGMFDLDETVTIVALAMLAGSYTIYGGLKSVAWTDFMQFVVMMLGGLVVAWVGLDKVGGLGTLMHSVPEKFKIIYPATDKDYPWFGVWTLFLSVGIWYNCTNQFIVQRCLGARSEWDARMGVVFAGFMKVVLPLLIVIPGIVAFQLYPNLQDKDLAFPTLVRDLLPAGLSGIVMAGLASGMLSHISSVLNSCSTVFTMDLYQPLTGGGNSEDHLVRVGRWSGFVILLIATLLAIWFTRQQLGVFLLIQNIGAWVAAPIAAVFLVGVLWRRATAASATFVLWFGFPYTWFVENVLFKNVALLLPYDNWLNRTFVVWITSIAAMIVVSLFTRAPSAAQLEGIIWSPAMAALPEAEKQKHCGLRSLFLWWTIFIALMALLYAYMIWFQFLGPAKGL
ncbi:MAG: sodium/solute symporter [Verrucomicrobiaceae bacterium]|nr:sodium/solute symporter [Verrucomicrobiaceae bacterium]